jgi:hypothetical protein
MQRTQHPAKLKINNSTFPYTPLQLHVFKKEVEHAGSFYALMIQKNALEKIRGLNYIVFNKNIERYRQTYLTGAYESLSAFYDTTIPYVFWLDMYERILKRSFIS